MVSLVVAACGGGSCGVGGGGGSMYGVVVGFVSSGVRLFFAVPGSIGGGEEQQEGQRQCLAWVW